MKPFLYITVLFALGLPLTQAEVYKVVDENGRVTFTDNPTARQEKGEKISVSTPNIQTPQTLPESANNGDEEKNADTFSGYSRVMITQPSQGDTIPPGQIALTVQVAITPTLQPGDKVVVLYDGQAIAPPASSTSFHMEQLYRGTHQLKAQVVNSQGKVVAESAAITFYVQRASVLNKPKAPTAK